MLQLIDKIWYKNHWISILLLPFSWLYRVIISLRKRLIVARGVKRSSSIVIVVGNLTVGGAGKTPLVIALVKHFLAKGIHVGVVSRGYRSTVKNFPYHVQPSDSAALVGDEPALMASLQMCPIVIAPERAEAVQYLNTHFDCQLIISDDGLQHYKMDRQLEIVVVDGKRNLGNGFCIPAGPLREPISRLKQVDLIVVNSGEWPGAHKMACRASNPVSLQNKTSVKLADLEQPIAAVAGIGNPQRFFDTLTALNCFYKAYSFPDHYSFRLNDFNLPEKSIIMTEKDAIKCNEFAQNNWYYLPITAVLQDSFWQSLDSHPALKRIFD